MKVAALLFAALITLLLGGCLLPSDPAFASRSGYWFRHTNPAAFFRHEVGHGRVYFIGMYDTARGGDSPAPGIARDDPAYKMARTWFVPVEADANPRRNERFVASAREFARRYNPLVLAYLREHPTAK